MERNMEKEKVREEHYIRMMKNKDCPSAIKPGNVSIFVETTLQLTQKISLIRNDLTLQCLISY
jgi:hypothetical protein